MKFNNYHEYVNAKGKLAKPVVDISGDTVPASPNTPIKGGKPYMVKGGKKPKKAEKGFGDEGDKSLKYNPAVNNTNKGKAPANIPTVEQLELANLVADAVHADKSILENIVVQLKNKGLLGPLVAELLEHRATYNYISDVMCHETYGPEVCTKLSNAMCIQLVREEVAKPFGDQLDADDEEEVDPNMMGGSPDDEEDMGDDDMSLGGDEDDNGGLGDDSLEPDAEEDPMGDPGMDPNMMGPDGQPMDPNMMDPSMMGGDPNMDPNMMGMPPMDPNMMPPAMRNFQRAFQRAYQRAYQRAMMRKN